MGYYIQTSELHGKAEEIAREFGGEIISCPKFYADIPAGKALICVVDNGAFEAAGFTFDENEFVAFTRKDDPRAKKWVLIDRAIAERESNYSK